MYPPSNLQFKNSDKLRTSYDNVILLGDFNVGDKNVRVSEHMQSKKSFLPKILFQNLRKSLLYLKRMIYLTKAILPILRKVYDRITRNQIYLYLNKIFSKYQCGFWKAFSVNTITLRWLKNGVNLSILAGRQLQF